MYFSVNLNAVRSILNVEADVLEEFNSGLVEHMHEILIIGMGCKNLVVTFDAESAVPGAKGTMGILSEMTGILYDFLWFFININGIEHNL